MKKFFILLFFTIIMLFGVTNTEARYDVYATDSKMGNPIYIDVDSIRRLPDEIIIFKTYSSTGLSCNIRERHDYYHMDVYYNGKYIESYEGWLINNDIILALVRKAFELSR